MKKQKQNPLLAWARADATDDVLSLCKSSLGLTTMTAAQIVSLPQPDPTRFSVAEEFRDAYWQAEVLSKYPFDGVADRRAAAMQSFYEFERQCARSNERLADLWNRPIPEGMRRVLLKARHLLSDLFRGFNLDEVIEHCGWGPGATVSRRRAQSTPQNKWLLSDHITLEALPYLYALADYTGWTFHCPTICQYNKVVTVPKNAKTDRTIAIEPEWNSFFQLGIGGAIRKRLQRRGLLRACAQEVNQRLAKRGSEDGFLSTIDLKGASDCVSLALVEALFPECVTEHLLRLRSPYGLVDGKLLPYEKISSMGNGYTFELETALFWAICSAASGHAVTYGDDIIVDSGSFSWVCEVLNFCGLTVNVKKSHYASRFRESCGGHYFAGVNVTPPYVRKKCVGAYRISLANRISEASATPFGRSSPLQPVHRRLVAGIPKALYGPSYVDHVVHGAWDEAVPRFCRKRWSLTGLRLEVVSRQSDAPGVGALRHYLWGKPERVRFQRALRPDEYVRVSNKKWVGHWEGYGPWY